jgi:hypothetical protein
MKFKVEFCVEVKRKALKDLSDEDALRAVVSMVEKVWDLGHDTDEAERPAGSNITDSYGFEAELVD